MNFLHKSEIEKWMVADSTFENWPARYHITPSVLEQLDSMLNEDAQTYLAQALEFSHLASQKLSEGALLMIMCYFPRYFPAE